MKDRPAVVILLTKDLFLVNGFYEIAKTVLVAVESVAFEAGITTS